MVLDAVNRVLDRRKYFREKKRSYRLKEREEIDRLTTQLAQLQLHAKTLRLGRQLYTQPVKQEVVAVSWKTIAIRLRRDKSSIAAEHDELTQQVELQRKLIGKMQHFVTLAESIPSSPRAQVKWQHVSLSGHPESRKLCKEWATQQLYYNTEAAFRSFPKAPADDEFMFFDMDLAENWINVSDCSQYVWNAPLEVARFMLCYHLRDISISPTDVDIEEAEWTENTVLYRFTFPMASGDDASVVSSSLQGHFHEADRCVFVARQIQGDELCQLPLRQSQTVMWMDLRRLDSSRTSARVTSFSSLPLQQSGKNSLDEMAKFAGIDTTDLEDAEKLRVLRHARSERAFKNEVLFRDRVNAVLDRLWKQLLQTELRGK
ncbi:unnamed protein product [Aphanomyces euteiches]|uniref:Uncharacterized protein n=1 Tax=Aphanomyces euteiches TaxID=100861 RepID=A0A6G0WUP5_9STRA|nr:hypothetical protein Ae201684_011451 [Aphanomyces euteiches]KAH9097200.1 hypothetical protein Ae201684P_011924 [Aphanomyces euteiches]KAH9142009.1 hypothetical protein AeRB84_013877 [Aphanomyces euteiches]